MATSLRSLLIVTTMLAATTAATADDNTKATPWTSKGLRPVPPARPFKVPNDESIEFILEDGSSGFSYVDCRSEAPGQRPIDSDDALPVGNGRSLACSTLEPPAVMERLLLGEDGTRYCWKGVAARYRIVGDSRLDATATQTPANGTWSLRATSKTPWTVVPVSFSVAKVWPLWFEVQYQTVDFAPARDAKCDGVLR